MTDKPPPTDAELRAHLDGLIKSTARIAASTALLVVELAEKAGLDVTTDLRNDANNVRRAVDDLDRGVLRGRIDRSIRTRGGAIVDPFEGTRADPPPPPTPLPAATPRPRPPVVAAPSIEDWEAAGEMPDLQAMMKGGVK